MAERPLDADDIEREFEGDADADSETVESTESPADHRRRGARILPFPTVERRRDPEPESRLRDVLGRVLRDERLAQERTLADVADDANISLPYLSEVERGVKEVSSDLLDAIGDALDLPLDEVLERAVRHIRSGSVGGSGITMLAA